MNRTKLKHKVRDEILYHAKTALYAAADEKWTEEEMKELRKQLDRVARFLGYENTGSM